MPFIDKLTLSFQKEKTRHCNLVCKSIAERINEQKLESLSIKSLWEKLRKFSWLLHANRPATKKVRGPKPAVLVRGTNRSPWPAECKWRRVL